MFRVKEWHVGFRIPTIPLHFVALDPIISEGKLNPDHQFEVQ